MTARPALYVALLRGINVGGNAVLSMNALRNCFERLGYHNVRTYIQSGNVIFSVPNIQDPRKLEEDIEAALYATFSLPIRVVVRSYAEITQLIRHLPASWKTSTQKCNVIFLHHTIDSPDIMHAFSPKPDIEELHYYPGVLFWSADTGALTKSAMIGLNKSALYQAMTVRNLNTTCKIYDLMQTAV